MTECIFCKIVKGEIPSTKIFETDTVLVFLDIFPVNKGHCLVIPKSHHEIFTDIPDTLLSDMMKSAKKAAGSIMRSLDADGYNLMMNNHAPAGQVVMHAHIHIVPRFKGDGLKHWPGRKYGPGEEEKISSALREST